MAVPAPREVFLANMPGRAVVLAEGPRGSVLRPFGMAAWYGRARGIICGPLGEWIFNSQINSGTSRSGGSNIYELLTQRPIYRLNSDAWFTKFAHQDRWRSKKRAARERYEASVSIH